MSELRLTSCFNAEMSSDMRKAGVTSEPPGLTDGPLVRDCSTEVLLLVRIMFWNLN